MVQPTILALHKNEWERLKKQAGPPEEPNIVQNEYLKGLIEKSQEWLKTWPDTVQGHVLMVNQMKRKRREREIAIVQAFEQAEKLKKGSNTKHVNRARQLIFENSCYGRQLLSALIESKTIEEREVQLQFKKQLKDEALKFEKEQALKNNFQFGHDEEEDVRQRKIIDKELAKINKATHEMNVAKVSKEKEEERKEELEDARLMKQVLDFEDHDMDHCKIRAIEAAKEYVIVQKTIKEQKIKREEEDDKIVKVWSKYHDRIRRKEQRMLEKIHHERDHVPTLKTTYDMLEKSNEIERKRYNDFVEKGIINLEKRVLIEDQKDVEKQAKLRSILLANTQENKKVNERQQLMQICNKLIGERQSLFTKACKRVVKEHRGYEMEKEKSAFSSFNVPSTSLRDDLKERTKVPTPWNALKTTHAQFAQQASETLQECKYKTMARKVVDEYRKINCLDSTTLPVSNY